MARLDRSLASDLAEIAPDRMHCDQDAASGVPGLQLAFFAELVDALRGASEDARGVLACDGAQVPPLLKHIVLAHVPCSLVSNPRAECRKDRIVPRDPRALSTRFGAILAGLRRQLQDRTDLRSTSTC